MAGFIASIVEAFDELRVNKGRIILALIGITFSVFALTSVIAGGKMFSEALAQSEDRMVGRDTTIQVGYMGDMEKSAETQKASEQVHEVFTSLGITHTSRYIESSSTFHTLSGAKQVLTYGVDPEHQAMYRAVVEEGRWFTPGDDALMVSPVVVNEHMYGELGTPPIGESTVTLFTKDKKPAELLVVGVTKDPSGAEQSTLFYLAGAGDAAAPALTAGGVNGIRYDAWVPSEQASQVKTELERRLDSEHFSVDNTREWRAGTAETLNVFFAIVVGVAGVILLLGTLGLLNIALVTMRYRVREIGIRRSYGATGARIFVGVLMESVVATTVAGAIGVALAVVFLRTPIVGDAFSGIGLVDVPPFPFAAVLVGMLTAVAVGCVAGIVPAIIATRIKVIDAIRS